MKKSEQLAIENAQRIAGILRAERNDAVALAQTLRERLEQAETLLAEAKAGAEPGLAERIAAFLG